MKKVAILSRFSGQVDRGVETWAKELSSRLKNIDIYSKNEVYKFWLWNSYPIIISTGGRFEVILARIITFLTGKMLVVFGHSGPGVDDKWNLLCSPNVFVCFSKVQSDWAKKHKFSWTKLATISHSVDLSRFKPKRKKKGKLKTVLCVAANIPSKRIDLVRKAAAKLRNTEFLAVGKGNQIEVSYEKMPEIYQKADLFCFVPESYEAFGLVYLEAMASNLPVVTIDDPIRREIVGEAGLFIKNPENTDSLAKNISQALKIDWKDKPRKQAEKFSWDSIINKYHKLFSNL